jgi:hypothetical protein
MTPSQKVTYIKGQYRHVLPEEEKTRPESKKSIPEKKVELLSLRSYCWPIILTPVKYSMERRDFYFSLLKN